VLAVISCDLEAQQRQMSRESKKHKKATRHDVEVVSRKIKKKGVVQSKIDRRLHKDAHVGENKRKKARKKKKTLKQRNQQNTI
jgi:hypothetical protein